MKIKLLRTFIPTKDFELSIKFYNEIGFKTMWKNDELAEMGTKEYNFFLQKFYVKAWAENLMMQLFVEDLDALYDICEPLISKYEGTKIKPIFTADYGRTFHLIGPAGELWHMTETKKEVKDHSALLCDE